MLGKHLLQLELKVIEIWYFKVVYKIVSMILSISEIQTLKLLCYNL